MTMPHLMNCPHSGEGWCLDCVKELYDKKNSMKVSVIRKDKPIYVTSMKDKVLYKITNHSCLEPYLYKTSGYVLNISDYGKLDIIDADTFNSEYPYIECVESNSEVTIKL